jgi:hypothetical protein
MSTSETAILKPQSTAIVQQTETSSMVLAAQAKALIEARYIVALQHPRDLDVVREKLMKECKRPHFAEVARYRKPVGKGIEGPSIRFAEAAIRCMTNVAVETITVFDDRERRIVRVSVTDIESNVPYSQDVTIQKTIERSSYKDGDVVLRQRLNSYGKPVYLLEGTDDDILNKQNALISKAVRTLGLRLVPGDLVDEAMDEIIATQKRKDAEDPDAAKRKILDAFGAMGVTVAQIKDYLKHDIEILEPKELLDLRALYAALKDGETTWREIMDERKPAEDTKKPEEKQAAAGGTRAETVLNKVKGAKITKEQVTRWHTFCGKQNMTDDDKHRTLAHFGYESSNDITVADYDKVIACVESGAWADNLDSEPSA